jgi:2-phosphosulfolactate phosphatase
MYYDQSSFDVRFEWGEQGLLHIMSAPCVIIVDVLSFSTCVDIIVGNGAIVYPYRYRDSSAEVFAQTHDAELASHARSAHGYSLSPSSLLPVPAGTRLVLPSPNGSTLAHKAEARYVLTACLRNYAAVAAFAERCSSSVTVIAAGERWSDGSIRFALEDMIGAGAVISALSGSRSPEAQAAAMMFGSSASSLGSVIQQCSSGRELIERGFPGDVELAVQANCSTAVPLLHNGMFINAAQHS